MNKFALATKTTNNNWVIQPTEDKPEFDVKL